MEAFVRIVETGSFSAAARQMRMGQPAISKSIAQLELRLGTRLLSRSTRGLSLTEAGLGFYERARRAIEEANEADLAATGAGTGLTGRLRFSATVTFARLHVMPSLPGFLAAHPALTIEAILDDRNVDLIGENIDLALRMGEPTSMTATGRRVATSKRVVVATASYLRRHGVPRHPRDLSTFPAVTYTQGGGGETWTFAKGSQAEVVTLKGMISTSAAEGVREAVFADMGLAVAAEWMFQPELDDHRVDTVLSEWTLPSIDLWAVYPAGRQATAKARAFASFITETLAKHPSRPPETLYLPWHTPVFGVVACGASYAWIDSEYSVERAMRPTAVSRRDATPLLRNPVALRRNGRTSHHLRKSACLQIDSEPNHAISGGSLMSFGSSVSIAPNKSRRFEFHSFCM